MEIEKIGRERNEPWFGIVRAGRVNVAMVGVRRLWVVVVVGIELLQKKYRTTNANKSKKSNSALAHRVEATSNKKEQQTPS